jgi:O-antigen/teichoic acid export membrane protein
MIKRLLQNPLVTMMSATTVGQGISFLLSIVLARIYGPSHFGELQIFLSSASLISVPALLKFDVALVAAESEKDSENLFQLSWLALLLFAFSSLIGVLVWSMFSDTSVPSFWYLLPFSVFGVGLIQLCWMWFVRTGDFKKVYWVRILESLALGLPAVFLSSMGISGLVYSNVTGQLLVALTLFILFRANKQIALFRFHWIELKKTFKKFSVYPKINILQGFNDMLQVSLPIILLSKNYNDEVAGLYSQSIRVLQLPSRLIIIPLAHVFFNKASLMVRDKQDLYPYVFKTAKQIFLFCLPFVVLLILGGPLLFKLIFGEKWTQAGVFAAIIAPWLLFDLVRAPIVQVSNLINKQSFVLRYSIGINVCMIIVLMLPSVVTISPEQLLAVFSASQSLLCGILILLILQMSRNIKPHSL